MLFRGRIHALLFRNADKTNVNAEPAAPAKPATEKEDVYKRQLDVGAIEYIHRQIVAERDKGTAVLLVSLELDEVMNLSLIHIFLVPTVYSLEVVVSVE